MEKYRLFGEIRVILVSYWETRVNFKNQLIGQSQVRTKYYFNIRRPGDAL